jgi:hypothetical protein
MLAKEVKPIGIKVTLLNLAASGLTLPGRPQ